MSVNKEKNLKFPKISTYFHHPESPSSDDVLSSPTEHNLPSTSSATATNTTSAKVQCTDTKLTSSDDDGIDFNTNTAVPVPSTSTGITSNGLFRLAQSHADSDDDPSPENSPRAIPIPINGSHHSLSVNNYSSGIDDERPNRYNSSRRRKINISVNRNQNNYGHYSSHSNSRLSSSCSDDDDDASSNESSMLPFFDSKKRKLNENGNDGADIVVADENGLTEATTTTNQSSWLNFTPDSGVGCSSSTSTGRHDGNNNANGLRNNGDTSMKLFQQKVARVRRNYRNNFGDDSDSD